MLLSAKEVRSMLVSAMVTVLLASATAPMLDSAQAALEALASA